MKKLKIPNLIFSLVLISLIASYILGEDSLGGAKHDYLFHQKFIELFAKDFNNTIQFYGTENLNARNSPVLYIFLSFLIKLGFPLEFIKYLNSIAIIFLFHSFCICLRTKYRKVNFEVYIFFLISITLSPTIRSLLIWPYPLIWALIFFIYSIYFYLKFLESKFIKNKFKYALRNIFFVAFSAYLTPNFSIFALYFFYYFLKVFRFQKEIFYLIFLNLILAIPAFIYYHLTDYYILSNNYPFPNLNLNFSNKIIIISSLIFFYFLPFLKIKDLNINNKKFNINYKNCVLIFFIIANILLFDFVENAGGGIFFHLSNLLFNNSVILFLIFTIFIYLINKLNYLNFNNIYLFFIIILFNIQYTIYHKYFDPLLLFLFLFLFDFKQNKNLNLSKISKNYFILYSFFLLISFGKTYINY